VVKNEPHHSRRSIPNCALDPTRELVRVFKFHGGAGTVGGLARYAYAELTLLSNEPADHRDSEADSLWSQAGVGGRLLSEVCGCLNDLRHP
jgi:hypothetical protein